MSYEKDTAPLERAKPAKGGFFDKKKIALMGAGLVAIGAAAAWGFSIRGEDTEEIKVSDVQPANIRVDEARPHAFIPQPEETAQGAAPVAGETPKGTGTAKRKGPPEGFRKISPVVMRGKGMQQQGQPAVQPVAQQSSGQGGGHAAGYPGQEGYMDGGEGEEGYAGAGNGMHSRRTPKEAFYAGGGAGAAGSLDVAGELVGELPGCVVKAGQQITLQTRSKVRTTLPQKVLGYVVNPVDGIHFLGNGEVERCTAIPAGSTILSEVNSSGVERGDLRIQMCALRLDLLGGGRRVLGCQPGHGADGGAGVEADSDYAVSGIATGILIEAALASARGLGGLIAGPAGIAVQVGTQGVSDVGSEYVRRELMRPPVLTMNAGAIYGVQLNGDLSLPID